MIIIVLALNYCILYQDSDDQSHLNKHLSFGKEWYKILPSNARDHVINLTLYRQYLNSINFSNFYPKYYYYESFKSSKFFDEHCIFNKSSWAKSMQSYFFMDQLKDNRFDNRVINVMKQIYLSYH